MDRSGVENLEERGVSLNTYSVYWSCYEIKRSIEIQCSPYASRTPPSYPPLQVYPPLWVHPAGFANTILGWVRRRKLVAAGYRVDGSGRVGRVGGVL